MRVTEPRHYATDALLRDGGSIHIRAIRPDDKQRLLDLFERLSSRSVYFRFFQTKQRLTDEELRYFTELDFTRDVALVATLQAGQEEHIIGVGRYFRIQENGQPTTRAEVAFTVADAHQGRGVGTLLLEHLAAIARRQGIDTFEAYVLGENNRMLEVFAASGFTVQRALDTGVFHVAFPTADTPQVQAASTERERVAAAQSMRAFLNPRAVAVVGVSRRGDGVGRHCWPICNGLDLPVGCTPFIRMRPRSLACRPFPASAPWGRLWTWRSLLCQRQRWRRSWPIAPALACTAWW